MNEHLSTTSVLSLPIVAASFTASGPSFSQPFAVALFVTPLRKVLFLAKRPRLLIGLLCQGGYFQKVGP